MGNCSSLEREDHIESGYHKILEYMSDALLQRPFMLGQSPSIADFGLMGPMLRHFGQDPTPAEIMRDQAPLVFDWLGRMWNARAYHAEEKKFELTVQGCTYKELPVSRYRVYCLEQLRREFLLLNAQDQHSLKALLPYPEASVLWQNEIKASSGYDEACEAPFNRSINVFENGVPS